MSYTESLQDLLISDVGKILLMLFLVLILSFFEFYFPAEKRQSVAGKLRNAKIILLFLFIGGVFYALVSHLLPIERAEFSYSSLLQTLGALVLYLFVGDFVYYWYHRAQHKFAPLWALHELHHSDSELNATSSFRTFFLERPVQYLVVVLPTFYVVSKTPVSNIATLDTLGLAILPVVFISWLFFVHSNIKLKLGLLTPVVTGPQLHRLHHSTKKEHIDTNFAQFFPIFDILFGTYVPPNKNEFPTTGTSSLHTSVTFEEILTKPFVDWLKMFR